MPVYNSVGWYIEEFKQPLVKKSFEIDTEKLPASDVVVEILASGLCHTDLHLQDNSWSIDAMKGRRPGHEGIGKVVYVGPSATGLEVGDHVGIGWLGTSCSHCDCCVQGEGNLCAGGVPSPLYGGCFATYTAAHSDWCFKLPQAWVEEGVDEMIKRAPLLCAGATIYAPLKRWLKNKKPGCRCGIIGMGGLGHLAVMYAAKMGTETVLISRNAAKAEDAAKIGAHATLAMDNAEQVAEYEGTFDMILNTSPAELDWKKYMKLVATGGSFVLVGLPVDEIPVPVTDIVFRQVALSGSIVAGQTDTREMLHYAGIHSIQPMTETVSMDEVNHAMDRLEKGDVRYRFVLKVDDAMKKL